MEPYTIYSVMSTSLHNVTACTLNVDYVTDSTVSLQGWQGFVLQRHCNVICQTCADVLHADEVGTLTDRQAHLMKRADPLLRHNYGWMH